MFGVHPYPVNQKNLGAGSPFAEEWGAIRQVRSEFGDTDPIWITETGTQSGKGQVPNDSSQLTEAEQADVNTRLYNRVTQMPDVEAIVFHTLRNAPVSSMNGAITTPDYHFGFMRENWTPKPVFCNFVAKAGKTYDGC